MARTRVLVAEDSLTVRKRIVEVLSTDPDLEVVGEAEDGKQAIALCQALRPDVVTMDMVMPVMTGLSATEYIMAHFPTPILVVSASTNRGEVFHAYDALAAGAIDILEKHGAEDHGFIWERQLVSSVKMVSRIRVITHLRGRTPAPLALHEIANGDGRVDIVAIGASTGGPSALVKVLGQIAKPLRVPVVVVLHISPPFALAFADWLENQIAHRVAYARGGEPLEAIIGRVMMAPPNHHLLVEGGRLRLSETAERHSCRPSVDVLFESVATSHGSRAVGCLLTGMGRDGAAGLQAMRRYGAATIAQDEASSIVWGMPREAIMLGAAERVLPLHEIGEHIQTLCDSGRSAR